MKSFTLSTVFFVVTIVALAISNVLSWRETAAVRAKLDRIRVEYGLIGLTDPDKTYVYRFVHDEYRIPSEDRFHGAESFRIVPATGTRYVLHLSELDAAQRSSPEGVTPVKTIPLDDWRSGAVVSCSVLDDRRKTPRVLIKAGAQPVLEYASPNSWGVITQESHSWPDLLMAGREVFDEPNQRIRLYWWYADQAKRGFLFWLEPHEQWKKREAEASE